jgi:hypothetical protein
MLVGSKIAGMTAEVSAGIVNFVVVTVDVDMLVKGIVGAHFVESIVVVVHIGIVDFGLDIGTVVETDNVRLLYDRMVGVLNGSWDSARRSPYLGGLRV